MAIDPQMQAFLDQLAAAGMPPDFAKIGPAAAKEISASMGSAMGEGPALLRVEDLQVSGDTRELAARLYVPSHNPRGLVIFYHGGGWVLGNIAGYDAAVRRLAAASRCAVLVPEYRLAPEYPFPAAVKDCYAVLLWAAGNAHRLVGRVPPLIVAGDSAGGNLAAVAALLARDLRGPEIAAQLLIFPVTDADFSRKSYLDFADGYMLPASAMRWFWDQYLPDTCKRGDPLASPLRAESLAGLPFAIVEIAGYDPLRDEGEAYATRLEQAGVGVSMRRWDGLCHGFFQMGMMLEPAGTAIDAMGKTLLEHLPEL